MCIYAFSAGTAYVLRGVKCNNVPVFWLDLSVNFTSDAEAGKRTPFLLLFVGSPWRCQLADVENITAVM